MKCQHLETAPVEVSVDRIALALGDPDTVEVVAQICLTCHEQLAINWGCPDCQWIEERTFSELLPRLIPGQPCPRHAAA